MMVTPNFNFNGDCKQALELYEKAFDGEITQLFFFKDADPSDFSVPLTEMQRGYVYHAEMIIGNQRLFFSDNIDQIPFGKNLSLVITFEHKKDVERAYEIMIDGGYAITPLTETTYSSCFASLVDKFGMRWELMTETKNK